MKLFDKLFTWNKKPGKRKNLITKSFSIPNNPYYEWIFTNAGRSISSQKAMEFYRSNSTVATAVDMIASACEQIRPVLRTAKKGVIRDHRVLRKLMNPNSHETYNEFVGKLTRHYLLKHDSFPLLLGNVDYEPAEIYAIKPQNITIYSSEKDGYAQRYVIVSGIGRGEYDRVIINGQNKFLDGPIKELYHIMGFSSRNTDIQGDSPLEAIALEIDQQLKGKYHNVSILEKGGRLSLVIAFNEPDTEDDEHKERKQRINEQLSGPDNAGGIAVISGQDVAITELGKTNKDMDFATLDKMAKNIIFLKYGIPLPLVSLDASTYNNVENAMFNFYENTVLPIYNTIFTGLSKVLLPRYGLNSNNYVLTYNPESIPIIMRQKLKEIAERRKINVESPNEIREILGREARGGQADRLFQSNRLVPIDNDEEGITE